MRKRVWIVGLLFVALLSVINCQTASLVSQALASATPTETKTPRPTFTTIPSVTPTSTSTSTQTLVPTVTRTATRRPVTLTPRPTPRPSAAATAVPSSKLLPVHKIQGLKPGMDIELAKPTSGQLYCQTTHLEFVADNPTNKDSFLGAQGKHWAYFRVWDVAAGTLRTDLPVTVFWPEGSTQIDQSVPHFDTWLADRANALGYNWMISPGDYNGDFDLQARYGTYWAQVSGGNVVSDIVRGLGIDDGGRPAANVVQWVCYTY